MQPLLAQMSAHARELHALSAGARQALAQHAQRTAHLTWAQRQAEMASAAGGGGGPASRLFASGSVQPSLPSALAHHIEAG